jgi:putative ABC transport system permease protein
MGNTFFKNLFRDIKKSLSRFLSIVVIIAIGVSFYAGVRATSPDMKVSGDNYFTKTNLMDFKLISTLGITADDIEEFKKVNGVTAVEGTRSIDAVTVKDQVSLVLNVNSLPTEGGINQVKIVQGKRPAAASEAIVEDNFFKERKLNLGDKLVLESGNDTDLKDTLGITEFTIVGTAQSPLYVSEQRQLSSVGNGSVKGFVYILPEVFTSDVFTEAYVSCKSAASDSSMSENAAYKESTESIKTALKTLGIERAQLRKTGILAEANAKIADAENKLADARIEAEKKFAEARAQLDSARAQTSQGWAELKASRDTAAQSQAALDASREQAAQGRADLEASKDQVAQGQTALDEQLAAFNIQKAAAEPQLKQAEEQLAAADQQLADQKTAAAQSISSGMAANLAALKAQLDADPANAAIAAQYAAMNQLYENDINGRDFDAMYSQLSREVAFAQVDSLMNISGIKAQFDTGEATIAASRKQLEDQKAQLASAEDQLSGAQAELDTAKEQIASGESALDAGDEQIFSGQAQLDAGKEQMAQAEVKLNDADAQIKDNEAKLNDEEAKAAGKFEDAEAEIQKNRGKLSEIKDPDFYALGRSENVGYETFRQDSDRIDNIGKVFPLIFFLVAALVSLTTMTRMVQEKRIEIGTFKALGYSRGAIVSHYLIYALSASLAGSIIGLAFGFNFFPQLILNAYSSLYTIPDKLYPFNPRLALLSAGIAILLTVLAAVASTLDELREVPASLMRPKPPKAGKKIFLERISILWRRLSFTNKVTARNIFRYKQRLFMTVIGIAACTGLMITGFGLKGAIIGSTENQFNKIYKYDMITTLTNTVNSYEKSNIEEGMKADSNIKSTLFAYSKNASAKKETGSEDAYVVVPENKDELNKYIELTTGKDPLQLSDDGAIITKKFSALIGKGIGDTFELTLDDRTVTVKVAGITEHYIQHYIYMSPAYYKAVLGEDVQFNSFYGLLSDTSDASQNKTSDTLSKISGVNSVSFRSNTYLDFGKTMDSINTVVLVLIVSAGVLAFVVIFNLTNININERRRELATIKLLGFFNPELAAYVYRENVLLTLLGSVTGIGLGIFMANAVINTAETNVMMFYRGINPVYFLYSVLLTMAFSVIVNLAMYGKFDKIDMIESLKSAE